MTQYIEKRFVILENYRNNSAPCSKCCFFNLDKLKCCFPKHKEKKCSHKQGTYKGWNTKEYVEVRE